MSTRIAVPMWSIALRLHLQKGRQWSAVEHLILFALCRRGYSAAELAAESLLPRRLVIEVAIRLMRVGWVELVRREKAIFFRATPAGIRVADHDRLPAVVTPISRWAKVAIDQASGVIFRGRDLALMGASRVEKLKCEGSLIVLPKPDTPPAPPIQEDILGALLEEDETYVGCEFSGTRGTTDLYALAEVHGDHISGVPDSAPDAFKQRILGAATGTCSLQDGLRAAESGVGSNRDRPDGIYTNFTIRDLIVGGDAHRRTFEGILREAKSWVVVHSTFIYAVRFREWLPLLRDAVGRGAKIDILWGASPDEPGEVVSGEVSQCRKALEQDDVLERHVRLHPFSTRSHAKLLLADDGHGGVVGCLGSCNWLSTGFESLDISVRFRDPRVVAEIASYLAQLARTPSGHASNLTNDLAGLALNLRRLQGMADKESRMRAKVTFVTGAQHNAYVRRARDEASHRVVVTSHRLSAVGQTSVVVPTAVAADEKGADVSLYYGRLSGGMTAAMAEEIAQETPGVLLRRVTDARLHAKVLAWDDDDVVVSSLNWLSSDPPDRDATGEIGAHIHMNGVGKAVVSRLLSGLSGTGDTGVGPQEYEPGVS